MQEPSSRHSEAPAKPAGKAVVLLTKSAFAAAPHAEMRRLAAIASMLPGVAEAVSCYCEQGQPSLRDALLSLRDSGHGTIVIVPLMLPMEPSFRNWMTRSLKRWQREFPGGWPPIHISRDIAQSLHFEPLLAALVGGASAEMPIPPADREATEGSLVPSQKRRVLVCEGGACNAAGADVIWGHLRNRQQERKLRITGDGTMTAKSTCLGPCSLAPVLQVFPEGTYYGGVSEAVIDRIVEQHLLGGKVVSDFAYAPTGRKQRLRSAPPPSLEQSET
ncbi:(2Fe-2S) ferredoxin domain-containing protein [Nitratireductor thuwali]|uniref:Ferredoxin, 2Fe-2S n=1 Tax=Nitratireductor thuwali TaxID=2267699 RepID=A0ABY5MII2_9HYPH|nr:Ferredoxin, 2Fe-2S [Nitratireductor thuwali]